MRDRHTSSSRRSLWASTALVAALVVPQQASACGGFFCSQAAPVDQTAERIIFSLNEERQVTQIVEVLYSGPSEKFAWVLPVPGTPVPGVSSKQVFNRLQNNTEPAFFLNYESGCFPQYESDGVDLAGAATGGSTSAGGPTVTVLDSGQVGMFEYETISVDAADQDPADIAVRWLTDNGYDVGEMGAAVLRPYLANGLNLIAFRLQKGASTGSIRPITLTYEAGAMAIPIRPTAVAATEDMPILVWTLGAHRAVPTNYRSLEINELLIDWFNYGSNYEKVVTAAADEAGGQGFVTEFAGKAADFESLLRPSPSDIDRALGRDTLTLEEAMQTIGSQLGSYDGFVDVVRKHVQLRPDVTPEEFATCSYCYFYPEGNQGLGFGDGGPETLNVGPDDPIYGTDLDAFRGALEEDVLAPFLDAADLFRDHDYLTRLYTTMSPKDMTLDPVFELNPDLPDVSNVHQATFSGDCEKPWTVTLSDGTKVHGKDMVWPYATDTKDQPVNARVLQYSTSGMGVVIADNGATIAALHESSPASTKGEDASDSGGCSVQRHPQQNTWAWLGLGLLGAAALGRKNRARS